MDSVGSVLILIGSDVSLWVLKGPYSSFCVLMDSNETLWVLKSPYLTLLTLIGPYGSL